MAGRILQTATATACIGGAVLAGCASGNGSRAATNSTQGVNVGLDQYVGKDNPTDSASANAMTPDEMRHWLEQDATVLPSLAAGKVPEPTSPGDKATPPTTNLSPTVSIDSPAPADQESASPDQQPTAHQSTPSPASSLAARETADQRQQRLVQELASSLRRRVNHSQTPLREYAALAALELLEPGVAPDPSSIPSLTPRDIELLGAWRDLFRQTNEQLTDDAGEVGALSSAVAELAARMGERETLDLAHATLCSRVKGFGQYTPLLSTKMLTGRSNPAIVYTEVQHLTHREASGPDGEAGYLVELTQELSLYHDVDGLLAWRQPEQQVRDFSRQRRRDFFVVQRIDLPRTLSVGAYRLKITMRDKATGAVAETTLPIELVADASLVRAE